MNPDAEEINILLPLAFFLMVGFFGTVFGGIIWFLNKKKILKLAEGNQLFSVFRAAVLSIIGVFAISFLAGIAIFVIQLIKNVISN